MQILLRLKKRKDTKAKPDKAIFCNSLIPQLSELNA